MWEKAKSSINLATYQEKKEMGKQQTIASLFPNAHLSSFSIIFNLAFN